MDSWYLGASVSFLLSLQPARAFTTGC